MPKMAIVMLVYMYEDLILNKSSKICFIRLNTWALKN